MLTTADPAEKAALASDIAAQWRDGAIGAVGWASPPDRPSRPDRPELLPPRDMPRRGRGLLEKNRIALLHALAHIELNAIDLACDIVARFTDNALPRDFYDDWTGVADEEALHFTLLSDRLKALGATYGDLPAHDGLWEAAEATSHDLMARLAVVPLVLEARGLDVTPAMIGNLRRAGDAASVAVLERIYTDEIGHVGIGRRWFEWVTGREGLDPVSTWQLLVRKHFRDALKPPFNRDARGQAGLAEAYYEPLADPIGASTTASTADLPLSSRR